MGSFSSRHLVHVVLVRPLLRLVFGIDIKGREHLADLDQCIIVANHNSHLDILLLFYLLPARQLDRTRAVAAFDYFSGSRLLFRTVSFLFSPLWIDRETAHSNAVAEMEAALQSGQSLIIFPEGTRGEAGVIQRFRSGVSRIASKFPEVPVVPVFLHGPERAFPKGTSVPLPVWNHITVGPPRLCVGSTTRFLEDLESYITTLSRTVASSRHRPSKVRTPSTLIAVMGIDGSGKSTLSRNLARDLSMRGDVCLISDELEFFEHGNKQRFRQLVTESIREKISAHAKHAGSLKSYKVPKIADLLLRNHLSIEVAKWYRPDFVVQDGSPLLNMVGWAILYREELFDDQACLGALHYLSGTGTDSIGFKTLLGPFPELSAIRRLQPSGMRLPDLVLMLDADPETCCARITTRGEAIQTHENPEQLAKLRSGYLRVCALVEREMHVPVLVLGGELDRAQAAAIAVAHVERLQAMEVNHAHEKD